eukprot:1155026-Pelagomonas_calceolata.AAC.4
MAAPCAASPWTTLQATSAAPPAANRAQWKVCALAYMSLVMRCNAEQGTKIGSVQHEGHASTPLTSMQKGWVRASACMSL